ncbi:MAG: DUF296 domain-containing protein [Myxococcales bacterium]|nr:DUF296 domain-containing protein [Myxococcales bacterium]
MIVQSSQASRVLVLRAGRGEALQESLVALMKEQSARTATVVAGHGALQSVTFDSYDPRGRAFGDARTFAGAVELLSVSGHLMMRGSEIDSFLHVTVARDSGNGVEVVGGRLIEAPVVAVELTVMVHDDLHLERVGDAATGVDAFRAGDRRGAESPRAREPSREREPVVVTTREREPVVVKEPAKEPAREPVRETVRPRSPAVTVPAPSVTPPTGRLSLADAAKALESMPARREAPEDDLDDVVEVQNGDFMLHPTFGEVIVIREIEPGTVDIKIVSNGSFRRIKFDVFEVTARGEKDGHRIWQLKPRR